MHACVHICKHVGEDHRALDFVLSASPTPASALFGPMIGSGGGGASSDAGSSDGGGSGGGGGGDGKGYGGDVADGDAAVGAPVEVLESIEVSPGAISFVQQLCKRLRVARGAALFIDYGSDTTPQDSLRGILQHRPVHPLSAPGHVDLSVDVQMRMRMRIRMHMHMQPIHSTTQPPHRSTTARTRARRM